MDQIEFEAEKRKFELRQENRRYGVEPDSAQDGNLVGKDPRTLSHEDLGRLGHEPMSAQEALRLRCLDCCGGSPHDVRICTAVTCPSWPFRMGRSPWKEKRILSEERKAKLAERLRKMGRGKKMPGKSSALHL
jgi:hypothetical protein